MLKIENLTKIFNEDLSEDLIKTALDDINIHIKKGEFVTVIGGNGSGKSTFLNTISGMIKETSGKITLNGVNINKLKEFERAKYIGRVFQDPLLGTAHNMSVLENLYLSSHKGKKRKLKWSFKKEDEKRFINLVKELNLNLENNIHQKIGLLSGGQRQAITLLMATMNEPNLLLLDEHTAALDPKTANVVLNITEEIVTKNNTTTIMITHNMKDAINYGNRLIMFNEGKIVLDVKGEEKKNLKIKDLLEKFENLAY